MSNINRSLTSRFTIMFAVMLLIIVGLPLKVAAQNECSTDTECEAKYREGSTCLESGQCSNPFADGCLKRVKPGDYRKRLCNSDDKDQENCRVSDFDYLEIRVNNGDWDTSVFLSWILQVSLMELMDVPVRVGLRNNWTSISSFYNIEPSLEYSNISYPWYAIEKANQVHGDCLSTEDDCVHVLPDVWSGQKEVMQEEFDSGELDYLDGNGQVAKYSWYVPAKTAVRLPFSVTHMGLAKDRQRLAKYFKRPTRWVDYCHEVSKTNCSIPDGVADRYPDEGNELKFFTDGYIGHFRNTAKNNCTGIENARKCTGHILAPICTWSAFIGAQTYWNNISLESDGPTVDGGYSYGEMFQIYNAANATDSDVITVWYEPDSMSELFRGTEFQLTKVFLPTPSMSCVNSRVTVEDKCSPDPEKRRGNKIGSCDNAAHVTKKAIASTLRDETLSSPAAKQSPAYSFIRNFNIDSLQVAEMLRRYQELGRTTYAAREAVCEWIAGNESHLKSMIPPTHPREFQSRDENKQGVTIAAYSVGGFAIFYIVAFLIITYRKRKAAVFVYAQVNFIFVVLFGLLLVAIGAVLYCIESIHNICMVRVWFVCLGNSFVLVPLIIKVTALNHLMKASKRMRRTKMNLKHLYSSLLALSGIVTTYLIVWTIMDPSRSVEILILEDENVVSSYFWCRSESTGWQTAYNFWEALLTLWAAALAFQSRTAKAEFNESKSLGMMIYSHFVFMILRIAVSQIFDDNDAYTSSIATSFLFSLDAIVALTIYLLPKMLMLAERTTATRSKRPYLSSTANSIATSTNKGTSTRRIISFLIPEKRESGSSDESMSNPPKSDCKISSTEITSQSYEMKEDAAFVANQVHVKQSGTLTCTERSDIWTNSQRTDPLADSERIWIANCESSAADNEELKELLNQSYEEISKLKKLLREQRETQRKSV